MRLFAGEFTMLYFLLYFSDDRQFSIVSIFKYT